MVVILYGSLTFETYCIGIRWPKNEQACDMRVSSSFVHIFRPLRLLNHQANLKGVTTILITCALINTTAVRMVLGKIIDKIIYKRFFRLFINPQLNSPVLQYQLIKKIFIS